jgi:hypothetical protein
MDPLTFGDVIGAVPLIGQLYKWYRRPKLSIVFDPNKTYDKAFDRSVSRNGLFLHLLVRNSGKTVAKNCRATVLEVLHATSGGKYASFPKYSSPVELHWAHMPLECLTLDVDKEIPRKLDICYAHENDDLLHLFCPKFPRGVQTDFPPGKYKFSVRVTSDNAKAVYTTVSADWSGDWQKLSMAPTASHKK